MAGGSGGRAPLPNERVNFHMHYAHVERRGALLHPLPVSRDEAGGGNMGKTGESGGITAEGDVTGEASVALTGSRS